MQLALPVQVADSCGWITAGIYRVTGIRLLVSDDIWKGRVVQRGCLCAGVAFKFAVLSGTCNWHFNFGS